MNRIYICRSGKKSEVLAPAALRLYNGSEEKLTHLESGKPHFESTEISISHSGEYWVCILSDKPCGIDIERIREKDYSRLSERFFTEDENRQVGEGGIRRFFEIWTENEAYAKYTGMGLKGVLGKKEFRKDVFLRTIPVGEEYIMTLCSGGRIPFSVTYLDVD